MTPTRQWSQLESGAPMSVPSSDTNWPPTSCDAPNTAQVTRKRSASGEYAQDGAASVDFHPRLVDEKDVAEKQRGAAGEAQQPALDEVRLLHPRDEEHVRFGGEADATGRHVRRLRDGERGRERRAVGPQERAEHAAAVSTRREVDLIVRVVLDVRPAADRVRHRNLGVANASRLGDGEGRRDQVKRQNSSGGGETGDLAFVHTGIDCDYALAGVIGFSRSELERRRDRRAPRNC